MWGIRTTITFFDMLADQLTSHQPMEHSKLKATRPGLHSSRTRPIACVLPRYWGCTQAAVLWVLGSLEPVARSFRHNAMLHNGCVSASRQSRAIAPG